MKHITGTALRIAACAVLLVTGLALLAGKDDIRKFLVRNPLRCCRAYISGANDTYFSSSHCTHPLGIY